MREEAAELIRRAKEAIDVGNYAAAKELLKNADLTCESCSLTVLLGAVLMGPNSVDCELVRLLVEKGAGSLSPVGQGYSNLNLPLVRGSQGLDVNPDVTRVLIEAATKRDAFKHFINCAQLIKDSTSLAPKNKNELLKLLSSQMQELGSKLYCCGVNLAQVADQQVVEGVVPKSYEATLGTLGEAVVEGGSLDV